MNLLEKLIERQHQLNLSDPNFAKQLGISYALWNHTKHGRRAVSLKLMGRAAITFPDLQEIATQTLIQRSKTDEAASPSA